MAGQQERAAIVRVTTWNVWGLNEDALFERTRAVVLELASTQPDLAMIQEIVPSSESTLRNALSQVGYTLIVPKAELRLPYYVGVAVRDATMEVDGGCTDVFPHTRMRRHILTVRCILRASGLHVDALTAHFESEGNTQVGVAHT